MTYVIAYWFAAEPCLSNGDGRPIVIGETLSVEPPVQCCRHGLHGCIEPFDALSYARGGLLYRNRHGGAIDRLDDKICSSERTALAMIDATELLHAFARRQARSVSHLWDTPELVERWLDTGDEKFRATAWAAAREAAREAARATAWAAARAAARATAWATAWEAAQAAARAAAGAAVAAAEAAAGNAAAAVGEDGREAAQAAARAAAWIAAGKAAGAVAWEAARDTLRVMVEEAMP